MRQVRLVQLDGKIPNLAIMKLAHWHRAQGDQVTFSERIHPGLFEPWSYDIVYGSAIFDQSMPLAEELRRAYPGALVGGTGAGEKNLGLTVESIIGDRKYERYDYSIYPQYPWSLGFTQRGCRLKCEFCVVPKKEGGPITLNTIQDIWRPGTPRNIVLLDNDFFGQPKEEWRARMDELKKGKFKVSFNQGINVRLINDEAAAALSTLRYYNHRFTKRRLYTAWDNLGQERVFFRGLERLEKAGIPAQHLMVYMLTGFAEDETIELVMERYRKIREPGCMPFPMVFDPRIDPKDPEAEQKKKRILELKKFQRWVIKRYDRVVTWEQFGNHPAATQDQDQLTIWDMGDGYDLEELDGYNQDFSQEIPQEIPQDLPGGDKLKHLIKLHPAAVSTGRETGS